MAMAYINRQGGLHLRWLHTLTRKLIVWSYGCLLSARALHVLGALNMDLVSRGAPMYCEWALHLEIDSDLGTIRPSWCISVCLKRKHAMCAVFFTAQHGFSPHCGRTDACLAVHPSVCFSSPGLNTPNSCQSKGAWARRDSGGPALACRDLPTVVPSSVTVPAALGPAVTSVGSVFHSHPEHRALWAWTLSGIGCQLWD